MRHEPSIAALLFALPGALWRHPNGKPAYVLALSMIALYAGWITTFMLLLIAAFIGWSLFGSQ